MIIEERNLRKLKKKKTGLKECIRFLCELDISAFVRIPGKRVEAVCYGQTGSHFARWYHNLTLLIYMP